MATTTTPKAPTFTIARNPKGARWHRVSGDAQACNHSGTKAPVLVGRVEVTEADLRNYARCARCFPVAKGAPKATPKATPKAKKASAPAAPKAPKAAGAECSPKRLGIWAAKIGGTVAAGTQEGEDRFVATIVDAKGTVLVSAAAPKARRAYGLALEQVKALLAASE